MTPFLSPVLVELANQKPQDEDSSLAIKGIGSAKSKMVLPEFLSVIRAYLRGSANLREE